MADGSDVKINNLSELRDLGFLRTWRQTPDQLQAIIASLRTSESEESGTVKIEGRSIPLSTIIKYSWLSLSSLLLGEFSNEKFLGRKPINQKTLSDTNKRFSSLFSDTFKAPPQEKANLLERFLEALEELAQKGEAAQEEIDPVVAILANPLIQNKKSTLLDEFSENFQKIFAIVLQISDDARKIMTSREEEVSDPDKKTEKEELKKIIARIEEELSDRQKAFRKKYISQEKIFEKLKEKPQYAVEILDAIKQLTESEVNSEKLEAIFEQLVRAEDQKTTAIKLGREINLENIVGALLNAFEILVQQLVTHLTEVNTQKIAEEKDLEQFIFRQFGITKQEETTDDGGGTSEEEPEESEEPPEIKEPKQTTPQEAAALAQQATLEEEKSELEKTKRAGGVSHIHATVVAKAEAQTRAYLKEQLKLDDASIETLLTQYHGELVDIVWTQLVQAGAMNQGTFDPKGSFLVGIWANSSALFVTRLAAQKGVSVNDPIALAAAFGKSLNTSGQMYLDLRSVLTQEEFVSALHDVTQLGQGQNLASLFSTLQSLESITVPQLAALLQKQYGGSDSEGENLSRALKEAELILNMRNGNWGNLNSKEIRILDKFLLAVSANPTIFNNKIDDKTLAKLALYLSKDEIALLKDLIPKANLFFQALSKIKNRPALFAAVLNSHRSVQSLTRLQSAAKALKSQIPSHDSAGQHALQGGVFQYVTIYHTLEVEDHEAGTPQKGISALNNTELKLMLSSIYILQAQGQAGTLTPQQEALVQQFSGGSGQGATSAQQAAANYASSESPQGGEGADSSAANLRMAGQMAQLFMKSGGNPYILAAQLLMDPEMRKRLAMIAAISAVPMIAIPLLQLYSLIKPILWVVEQVAGAINWIGGAISSVGNFFGIGGGHGSSEGARIAAQEAGKAASQAGKATASNANIAGKEALSQAGQAAAKTASRTINLSLNQLSALTHAAPNTAVIIAGFLAPLSFLMIMTVLVITVIGASLNDLPFGAQRRGGASREGLCWPTTGTITTLQTYANGKNHITMPGGDAVDIAGEYGEPIITPFAGTATAYDQGSKEYGKRVEVETTEGFTIIFGHMSAFAPGIELNTPVAVEQNQEIGFQGNTGNVFSSNGGDGTHLHYETIGVPVASAVPSSPTLTLLAQVSSNDCETSSSGKGRLVELRAGKGGWAYVFPESSYEFVTQANPGGVTTAGAFAEANGLESAINSNFFRYGSNAVIGINSNGAGNLSYGFPDDAQGDETLLIGANIAPTILQQIELRSLDHKHIVFSDTNQTRFHYNSGGVAMFRAWNSYTQPADMNAINSGILPNAQHAVSGLPLLYAEGHPADPDIVNTGLNFYHDLANGRGRTIIGFSGSGTGRTWAFAVIQGATLDDMVAAASELGLDYAMGLDGGSSSQIYVKDQSLDPKGGLLDSEGAWHAESISPVPALIGIRPKGGGE